MKNPNAKTLEKRLLAAHARMREALVTAEEAMIGEGDGSSVVAAERAEIARVERALRELRAEPANAGRCRVCGHKISAARLALVPETQLCARDARAAERRGQS